MERLDNFLRALAVATAAIFVTIAHYAEEALGLPLWARLAVDAFVVAVALTVVRELLAATLLESSRLRRVLLGNEYVEGTWVDVVCYPDKEPCVGIVYFSSHRASLVYYGESISLEGIHLNEFSTASVRMEFPSLTFQYGASGADLARHDLAGIGSIIFAKRGGPPARYTGTCLDVTEQSRHRLIGRRVTDPEALTRLEDPATRTKTALALAAPLLEQCWSPNRRRASGTGDL